MLSHYNFKGANKSFKIINKKLKLRWCRRSVKVKVNRKSYCWYYESSAIESVRMRGRWRWRRLTDRVKVFREESDDLQKMKLNQLLFWGKASGERRGSSWILSRLRHLRSNTVGGVCVHIHIRLAVGVALLKYAQTNGMKVVVLTCFIMFDRWCR